MTAPYRNTHEIYSAQAAGKLTVDEAQAELEALRLREKWWLKLWRWVLGERRP